MSAALLDISFFCLLFNVTRLSLCKSGEKRESSMHIFAHERKADSCQQSCVLLSKRIRMNNDHTAHWSMMKRFDIVKPHVALFRVPRFEWVVLREGRLAHRTPFRPKSDRCVSKVELQVKKQLVCTRTVRSRSNVHPKMSSLALLLRFGEEQNSALSS